MEVLAGLLFVVVVFGGGAYLVVRWIRNAATRGREIRQLAEQGVPASALVTKVERIRRNRAGYEDIFFTYRFSDESGNTFEKRLNATPGQMTGIEEGGALDVFYLPSDPSISAAAHLVNGMRSSPGRGRRTEE